MLPPPSEYQTSRQSCLRSARHTDPPVPLVPHRGVADNVPVDLLAGSALDRSIARLLGALPRPLGYAPLGTQRVDEYTDSRDTQPQSHSSPLSAIAAPLPLKGEAL